MRSLFKFLVASIVFSIAVVLTATCDMQQGTANTNVVTNSNVNVSNLANTNTNISNSNSMSITVSEAAEPSEYQANVTVKLEALGNQQKATMPTLNARVARKGNDRWMEFRMPAGGRVVYLDKAGTNFLILPDMKQYAELNQESLGFEVRRMMMPGEIVQQVKSVPGVQRVGEEKYNGRDVIKYRYGAVTDTQSQAGQVATESFLYVDKQTGLPLHSETVSQSQTGGNVQGYSGMRIITEITDINTTTSPDMFAEPTGFQKVENEQIRAQVNMIFNAMAQALAQMMNQAQPIASPTATAAR
ncbi:MAG: hypothetical protein ACJ72Z_03930 [Pyrinomonadaceae bacterium]